MGKPLIQQRRGKGNPAYKSPSHRFVSDGKYRVFDGSAFVRDLIHDRAHSAPLLELEFDDGNFGYIIAPEGVCKNDEISFGTSEICIGNVTQIKNVPESVPISNLESIPGDGGKFLRSSGSYGYVVQKVGKKVQVKLSSGAIKEFDKNCRATIGVVAGGGRTEKPMVKAGKRSAARKVRNKRYPIVRGVAMNCVSHPFGGKEHHIGKASTCKRDTPPGRKVGHIAARRVGRKKR